MSVESFVPSTTLISMTDNAVRYFQAQLKGSDNTLIRLSTKASGCTGYAYVLDSVEAPQPNDQLVELDGGITVAVAEDAVEIVRNTEIDYVKEGINGIVKFNNPNVVNECGCGESFSVS